MDQSLVRTLEKENVAIRSEIVRDHHGASRIFFDSILERVDNLIPEYLKSYVHIANCERSLLESGSEFMIREQAHLLDFDQKLVGLREEYQGRINYALDLAERQVLDERGRVAEETSQMFAKMDCEWRAAFSQASSSHRARLEAIQQDLSVKVNTGQLQVRQLTSELRRLEQVHDRNSKRLAILLRRNETLRAPVEALTEEVEKMEAKVRIFHDSIEPELKSAKLRAKELDTQIREKAFILECLTQQRLQLESHRNVDMKYCYLKDLHERAISIAETDVTM